MATVNRPKCPKCGSGNIYLLKGGKIVCRVCGYDERVNTNNNGGKNMKHNNDKAVSPVIGVILMVAITVILAAIVAAFAFGMAPTSDNPKQVSFLVKKIGTATMAISVHGGKDVPGLTSAEIYINNNAPLTWVSPNVVGKQVIYGPESGVTTAADHVKIVGHFGDDTSQVLFDSRI